MSRPPRTVDILAGLTLGLLFGLVLGVFTATRSMGTTLKLCCVQEAER